MAQKRLQKGSIWEKADKKSSVNKKFSENQVQNILELKSKSTI